MKFIAASIQKSGVSFSAQRKKFLCLLFAAALCLTWPGCGKSKRKALPEKLEVEYELPLVSLATHEDLENRVLFLLDPYVLPISWWLGGNEEILYTREIIKRRDIPPEYVLTERFGSVSSRQNVQSFCKHFMNNSHPALTVVLSAHGGIANVVFDKA